MVSDGWVPNLDRLREFQGAYRLPFAETTRQTTALALHSLREATKNAPATHHPYFDEAVDCYEAEAYRGAVLMVWPVTIEHIYSVIESHARRFKPPEAQDFKGYEKANFYQRSRRRAISST